MKKNEPITKVMTSLLTTANEGDSVSKVRKMFDACDVHHIPVVSGDKLIGIISWNDILRVSFGELGSQDDKNLDAILDHTYSLTDIMNTSPTTLPVKSTVRDAARLLSSNSFHSLPIVDGEKLVGIVTSTDLIRYLAEL
jgi:CBS domain-containing protein